MKTLQEINEALSQTFTKETYTLAPIKAIDEMDYISWNDSTDLANRVFGPLGWSNTLVSSTFREFTGEFWDKEKGGLVERTFRGYEAVVRVTVRALAEDGSVIEVHRDGAGFADVVPQGRKNPLDLAFKAASSDAFSRAVKQLGDYFGLFLYDKGVPKNSHTSDAPKSSRAASKPTEKQLDWLAKKGLPQGIIDTLNFDQGKAALDALFAGTKPKDVVVDVLKMEWTEPETPKQSKYPLPARG